MASIDLMPCSAILRALMGVVQGGENKEPEVRLAVDVLWARARDAEAERKFLDKLPEEVKGELVELLKGLESACRDFSRALGIYLIERLPDNYIYPPDTLIAAVAAAVVAAEFRVSCARENIEQEENHELCVH